MIDTKEQFKIWNLKKWEAKKCFGFRDMQRFAGHRDCKTWSSGGRDGCCQIGFTESRRGLGTIPRPIGALHT